MAVYVALNSCVPLAILDCRLRIWDWLAARIRNPKLAIRNAWAPGETAPHELLLLQDNVAHKTCTATVSPAAGVRLDRAAFAYYAFSV